MAPGRRRGGKGLRTTTELSLGDLVLAKVKGFPAWPAKISRPEDWEKVPDPKKYFVYFYGTSEIAFVAPADIQPFTVEVKNKLSARCKGKPLRFTQAVEEICEEFEILEQKKLIGSQDDTSGDVLVSEDCSIDADENDDGMEVDMKDGNSMNKPHLKMETKSMDGSISPLERCSQRPGVINGKEGEPFTSGNVDGSVLTGIYGKQGTSKTDGPISSKKEVVSTSSSCSVYLSREEGSKSMKVEPDATSVEEPNGVCDTKEEGGISSSIQSTDVGHTDGEHKENKPGHLMETKKKLEDCETHRDSFPVILPTTALDSSGCVLKSSSLGLSVITPSVDHKESSEAVGTSSEKKEKKFMKGKNDHIRINDDIKKAEVSRKKINAQQGQLKQDLRNNEVSHAAKRSNSSDKTVATAMMSTQTNKKVGSNSVKDVMTPLWKGKMENHSNVGVVEFLSEDEDVLPPSKRHCPTVQITEAQVRKSTAAPKSRSSSVDNVKSLFLVSKKRRALRICEDEEEDEDDLPPSKHRCHAVEITEEQVRKNTAAPKSESSSLDNVKSLLPVATKRRALRLCDDEEEEKPKTPIHAGAANKVSPFNTAKKNCVPRGSSASQVMKKILRVEDFSVKEPSSAERPVEDDSASSQKNVEKKLRKTGGKSDFLSPKNLVPEKASVKDQNPKTPIHAGTANKVSHASDKTNKNCALRGSTASQIMKKIPRVEDGSVKESPSVERPAEDASLSPQKNVEKKLKKAGGKRDFLNAKSLVPEKASVKDENLKTSIHARAANKVSHASNATNKNCDLRGSSTKKMLRVEDGSVKESPSAERPVDDASPSSQKNVEKKLRKTRGKSDSVSPKSSVPEKASVKDGKTALSSPKVSPVSVKDGKTALSSHKVSPVSVSISRPIPGIEKPSKGDTYKLPDCNSQKKPPTSPYIVSGTGESSSTPLNKIMGERSKQNSISERKKATSKSSSNGTCAVLEFGGVSGNSSIPVERLEVSGADKISSLDSSKISDPDRSMKHLIAAAQAKRRKAHLQNLNSNELSGTATQAEVARSSPSFVSPILASGFSSMLQPDVLGLQAHLVSPSLSSDARRLSTTFQHETEQCEEKKVESGNWVTECSLSGGTEAAVARDAFEGMIETLSRTKESIGRATRLAIDCAKYGIANEVIELLIQKLQSENSMHRKVDLFFLVDSITQCSHKGIAGASYIPIVQAALSRLLGAAAPPSAASRENRRQCLKVLRLWQERKILPEAFLQPFMDEFGVANDETSSGLSLRRPSRVERPFDDPVREMEGMLVDEYGSNASFQLDGFLSLHAFDDADDDDQEIMPTISYKEVSERSPGEHTPVSIDGENQSVTPNERRRCVLEDVDGELEMEDVAVPLKDEMEDSYVPLKDVRQLDVCATTEVAASDIYLQMSLKNSELPPLPEGSPPLPPNSPPQTPPLPSSPPPLLPELPPAVPPPPPSPSQANPFPLPPVGPPSGLLSQQPMQAQPSTAPQFLQPLPPSISSSPSVYQHQPSTNEISVPASGNQLTQVVVAATHGLHGDLPGRNDVYGQFPFFVPLETGNPREPSRGITSRPKEFSHIDGYGNPQYSQPSQQFQLPFTQTPLHPNPPTQNHPNHLPYPNASAQKPYPHPQHPYPQWRPRPVDFNNDYHSNSWMAGGRSSAGAPFAHEGFSRPHSDRPPTSTLCFQPPRHSTLPAGASSSGHVMSGQVEMHAHNWRPA